MKRSNRAILWEVLLEEDPTLTDCITKCTGWGQADIPARMDAIYATLCNPIHFDMGPSRYQMSVTKVDLVVGPLPEQECEALACIADAHCFPHRTVRASQHPWYSTL